MYSWQWVSALLRLVASGIQALAWCLQRHTFLAFLRAALTAAEPLFLADCSSSASSDARSSAYREADGMVSFDKSLRRPERLRPCFRTDMHTSDGVLYTPLAKWASDIWRSAHPRSAGCPSCSTVCSAWQQKLAHVAVPAPGWRLRLPAGPQGGPPAPPLPWSPAAHTPTRTAPACLLLPPAGTAGTVVDILTARELRVHIMAAGCRHQRQWQD